MKCQDETHALPFYPNLKASKAGKGFTIQTDPRLLNITENKNQALRCTQSIGQRSASGAVAGNPLEQGSRLTSAAGAGLTSAVGVGVLSSPPPSRTLISLCNGSLVTSLKLE